MKLSGTKTSIALFALLSALSAFSGLALADDADSQWLTLDVGSTKAPDYFLGGLVTGNGNTLSIHTGRNFGNNLFLSVDLGQTDVKKNYLVAYPTVTVAAEWKFKDQYESLGVGRRFPINEMTWITGSLGVVHVSETYEDTGFAYKKNFTTTSGFVRLAIGSDMGDFRWSLTDTFYNEREAAPIDPTKYKLNSSNWIRADIGYQVADAWRVGLAYEDADYFKNTLATVSYSW